MNDNSDINKKILLRNDVFKHYKDIDNVIDYFCGECEISKRFWSLISNNVICIDKKCQESVIPNNIKRITGDNKNYLHLSRSVNIIDLDSYGLVLELVKSILKMSYVDKLVFFTDGSPTKDKKFKSGAVYKFKQEIDLINPDQCKFFLNDPETVFYGLLYKKI